MKVGDGYKIKRVKQTFNIKGKRRCRRKLSAS